MSDAARQIRDTLCDARSLCDKLGLLGAHGTWKPQNAHAVFVLCPFHDEKSPSCSVHRGPDGTVAVRCWGCQATGDALDLIARVRGLSMRTDFRAVLIEGAHLAGLQTLVVELEGGAPHVPRERPAPRPLARTAPERTYPAAHELDGLVAGAVAPADDVDASAWLVSRGLDPALAGEATGCLAVPRDAHLPRWASYQGRPWTATGHRLLVPARDSAGVVRSVRAIRVVEGDSPKRLPPGGHRASELVMADALGIAMLRGAYAPGRVLIVEGEPDFLTAATWPMREPTAVLGIVSGSWSWAFALRVPVGAKVFLWSHVDDAGDRYADEIAPTLRDGRGCRVLRWSPQRSAA